jgi:hypothetical protein
MWIRNKTITTESKLMSIQLLEPIVFIGSNLETSPVVRGTVNIKLEKSLIVNNLSIHIYGRMKKQWKKGKSQIKTSSNANRN